MPKKHSQSGIVSWLTETTRPVFMIDHRARMRFFNQGCAEITGCQPEDVIGKSCQYRTDPLANLGERVLQSFTPAAEVFQGQELSTETSLVDSQGNQRSLFILYLPLSNSIGDLIAIIGILIEPKELPPQLAPTFSQQLHTELASLTQRYHQQYDLANFIARGPMMKSVVRQIDLARNSSLPVLIQGESGTGKDYIARIIHQHSETSTHPFLTIECSKLPRSDQRRLLKEAITHAGELNAPGAIFLKDVEHLSTDMQLWIAKMFELKEWVTQYRLFASTTLLLTNLIEQDKFEESFYYTISSLSITLPCLEKRGEDFDLICQLFVEQHNKDSEKQLSGLSQETLNEFKQYTWLGNLRELKQVIDEACELCPGPVITIEHLPFRFQTGKNAQKILPATPPVFKPLSSLLAEVEKEEINRALEASKGNKAQAAQWLGLTRAKLYRRIETLNLEQNGKKQQKK